MQKIGAISKSPNRYQQLSTIAFAICVSVRYGIIDYGAKIHKLAHIRMDFAGIMQTIGIKGRYVGFTYIRPLYGFAPFWRS